MVSNGKIALIYFSRSPESEAEHKAWNIHSTKKQRLKISRFLNRRSFHVLSNTQLDVIHFDEAKQQGESFGEKIANAFQQTFEGGYTAAISIGNDCLNLNKINLDQVSDQITKENAIIGPTFRKGAYLIGLHASHFDKQAFQDLSWQTEQLEQDLVEFFQLQEIQVSNLERLRDINGISDFKLILDRLKSTPFLYKTIVTFISFSKRQCFYFLDVGYETWRHFTFGLRAPPQ